MDINILLWQPVKWAVHPEWVLCGAGTSGGGKGAGSAAPGYVVPFPALSSEDTQSQRRQLAAVVGPVIYMECNRSMYS